MKSLHEKNLKLHQLYLFHTFIIVVQFFDAIAAQLQKSRENQK